MPLALEQIRADNVIRINLLVERLREMPPAVFVPYVHPSMGGTQAPVLSVLESPGPKTKETDSLGLDNPDPTSAKQNELLAEVGLARTDLCPWNAYPWMARRTLDAERVALGAMALAEVIAMMDNLKVLFLQGYHARLAWGILTAFRPADFATPGFELVYTHHPNWVPTSQDLADRIGKERLFAWRRVAEIVHRRAEPSP